MTSRSVDVIRPAVARRCAPLRWLLAVGALALLAGCNTTRSVSPTPYEPLVARLFLEAKRGEAGIGVTLPRSGLTINVAPRPVLVEYDIVNAEVAQVELGRCLLLQLTPAAARDLYRFSVASLGRRLVLSLNDQVVGARPIDAAIADGVILIFLELPDEELAPLVERLKLTAADVAAAARKARRS
jgi:hypothetical protein